MIFGASIFRFFGEIIKDEKLTHFFNSIADNRVNESEMEEENPLKQLKIDNKMPEMPCARISSPKNYKPFSVQAYSGHIHMMPTVLRKTNPTHFSLCMRKAKLDNITSTELFQTNLALSQLIIKTSISLNPFFQKNSERGMTWESKRTVDVKEGREGRTGMRGREEGSRQRWTLVIRKNSCESDRIGWLGSKLKKHASKLAFSREVSGELRPALRKPQPAQERVDFPLTEKWGMDCQLHYWVGGALQQALCPRTRKSFWK